MELKNNTESGRSMVEMLGTLAIIGVLSIGGIAGYNYAMNKHRANTILGTVSEMAVTGSAQLISGNDLNLDSFGTKIDGSYGFGYNGNYSGTGSDFSIDVGNIPAKVCEHIKNAEYKMSYKTLINDAENGDCSSEDDNAIEFVFNDNLGTGNSGGGGNNDQVSLTPAQGYSCSEGQTLVYDARNKSDYCATYNPEWPVIAETNGNCPDGYKAVNGPNQCCANSWETLLSCCYTNGWYGKLTPQYYDNGFGCAP